MTRPFAIRTAAALLDTAFADRWHARESIDADARRCLRGILDAFAQGRPPIPVATVGAAAALEQLERAPGAVATLAEAFCLAVVVFGERLPQLAR